MESHFKTTIKSTWRLLENLKQAQVLIRATWVFRQNPEKTTAGSLALTGNADAGEFVWESSHPKEHLENVSKKT